MESQLFIIPIYLRSPEQYGRERATFERRDIGTWEEIQFGKRVELIWPPWQFNDIIGFFDISVNPNKIISVIEYKTSAKRISRNPPKNKHGIQMSYNFFNSSYYQELSSYFNNQKLDLKSRVSKILDELARYVGEKRYFIDLIYYRNILMALEIESFIKMKQEEDIE